MKVGVSKPFESFRHRLSGMLGGAREFSVDSEVRPRSVYRAASLQLDGRRCS